MSQKIKINIKKTSVAKEPESKPVEEIKSIVEKPVNETMKTCNQCGQTKTLAEFYRGGKCKECMKASHR